VITIPQRLGRTDRRKDDVRLQYRALRSVSRYNLTVVIQCVHPYFIPVARITYTVLVETLNPVQSINQSILYSLNFTVTMEEISLGLLLCCHSLAHR